MKRKNEIYAAPALEFLSVSFESGIAASGEFNDPGQPGGNEPGIEIEL